MTGFCIIKFIGRYYIMYKQTMCFIKGIGAGMVAGVAVYAVGSKMMKDNRRVRRSANKAMNAVNDLMDNVVTMFR